MEKKMEDHVVLGWQEHREKIREELIKIVFEHDAKTACSMLTQIIIEVNKAHGNVTRIDRFIQNFGFDEEFNEKSGIIDSATYVDIVDEPTRTD
jgi:hypothetical protein